MPASAATRSRAGGIRTAEAVPGWAIGDARVERDVLELSGVTAMIWLEGINDFSKNGNAPLEKVQNGMKDVVGRIRARRPDMRVIGATVVTALGSSSAAHGFPEQDEKRKALNESSVRRACSTA